MRERKKMRLPGFDYSTPGAYFITTCVQNRRCVFGEIRDGKMFLNEYGNIVQNQWIWLHRQYNYLIPDVYMVMPNHFHAVLVINPVGNGGIPVGNGRDRSLPDNPSPPQKIKPVPELIGAFKTRSSKYIHQLGFNDFRWQKSFYDHIIRNEQSLYRIRQYIKENPQKWESDIENSDLSEWHIKEHYQKIIWEK